MGLLLILMVATVLGQSTPVDQYIEQREKLVYLDQDQRLGGENLTSVLEKNLSAKMDALRKPLLGKLTANFRALKPMIDRHPLFQLIKSMPKGGLLHCHGIFDVWNAVQTVTYFPNCYVDLRNESSTYGFFKFAETPVDGWSNTVALRANAGNVTDFDLFLYNLTQFFTPPRETVSETVMWTGFNSAIMKGISLFANLTFQREAYIHAFGLLRDHGMTHVEYRTFLSDNFDLIESALEEFNSGVPEEQQITIRYISETLRSDDLSLALQDMEDTVDAQLLNPNIVGYDLVGEEDLYHRLFYYVPAFLKAQGYAASKNTTLDYYFHCAETDNVTHAESNLYDALILRSKRLGHALGLRNHPLLQEYVIANKTGLELCPVSNQMLRYVDDFRMHPGAYYIEKGMLATLSSDDPQIYGYGSAAPTYDFFLAYCTWDLTLPSLKALALNSLKVSALDEATKASKIAIFEASWQTWLEANQ